MSKDNPDALHELKKGLGHLFNAAKSAVHELPTKDLEDAVMTGVKEVGRALGNVKDTLETELLGKDGKAGNSGSSERPPAAAASPSAAPQAAATPATQATPEKPAEATPEKPAEATPDKPAQTDVDTGGGI